MSPLDLHVLSTPPAFVLSQDQTLLFNPVLSPLPCFPLPVPAGELLTTLWNHCLVFLSASVPLTLHFCFKALWLRVIFKDNFRFCIVFKVHTVSFPKQRMRWYHASPPASSTFFRRFFQKSTVSVVPENYSHILFYVLMSAFICVIQILT